MTIEQFIAKYNGKQVEYHSYDPAAKFQCVDLANQYIVEVLGLTPVIGTNAKDFPTKINKTEFDVLANTETFVPKKGDICIWSGSVGGGAGHIAVVRDDKATTGTFYSFDQNWSKPLYCTLETHRYNNVTHFLRPKVQIIQEPMADDLQKILSHYKVKTGDELISMVDEQLKFLADERSKVSGLEQTIKDLNAKYSDFVQKLLGILNPFGNPLGLSDSELVIQQTTELVKSTSDLQSKLTEQEKSAQKAEALLVEENQSLQKKLDKLQQQLDDMKSKHETEIATMQKRIDTISKSVDQHEAKQDQFTTFRAFIDSVISMFRK